MPGFSETEFMRFLGFLKNLLLIFSENNCPISLVFCLLVSWGTWEEGAYILDFLFVCLFGHAIIQTQRNRE